MPSAEGRTRAQAIAFAHDALAVLAARTYVPQLIRDLGGHSAPVIVENLVAGDVFPDSLRHTEPSSRRMPEELHALVCALPGDRARLIVKMSYWLKLLGAVLLQEKKEDQAERFRLAGQAARKDVKRRRLQEAPAGGGHEPGDDADGPRRVVSDESASAVGGHEPGCGLSSSSCAAVDVEPGCGASSASCAASAPDV